MSPQINIKSRKSTLLVSLLTRTDKRRHHTLYICSCYFDAEAAKKLIRDVEKEVKLNAVVIYVDRRQALSIGKADLESFLSNIRRTSTVSTALLYIVDSDELFHTKAYALIAQEDHVYHCGSLVIASANLTGSGLTNPRGNIESLLDTQSIELIREFVAQLGALKVINVEDLDLFVTADSLAFMFGLLMRGQFVHKWSNNLGQYLAVRYRLNKNGREQIKNEDLERLGFAVEAASISKRYFNFEPNDTDSRSTENLIRRYGIETHLGHWVPKPAIRMLMDREDGFPLFKAKVKDHWDTQHDRMVGEIKADFDRLLERNFIDDMDSPIASFELRVRSLLEDSDIKLWRIYSRYEFFELPYSAEQDVEIRKLHEEIVATIESRTNKNLAMKAYSSAIESRSLEPVVAIDVSDFVGEETE